MTTEEKIRLEKQRIAALNRHKSMQRRWREGGERDMDLYKESMEYLYQSQEFQCQLDEAGGYDGPDLFHLFGV